MFYVLGSFVEKCTPVRKDGRTYQKKKKSSAIKAYEKEEMNTTKDTRQGSQKDPLSEPLWFHHYPQFILHTFTPE